MDSTIRDIFSNYQIRKTKKQKTAFIEYTMQKATEEDYSAYIEKGFFGVQNIIIGDPDSAKVIFTAHYDTCARLPFPNFLTPKSFVIYLLYNLAVVLGFFIIAFAAGLMAGLITALFDLKPDIGINAAQLAYIALLLLMFAGPANKHTANDNTSGVTVLFGIMSSLPEEQRDKVAFVFFDHEESGLIGSSSFARKHKNVKNNTLLVNFDCVSDGKDIMILARKPAASCRDMLANAFMSSDDIQVDVTDKAFYPSDQVKFKKGIGIAAFKKTKNGLLYMNRIHTNKDTVYRRENIDFLVDGSVKLAALI